MVGTRKTSSAAAPDEILVPSGDGKKDRWMSQLKTDLVKPGSKAATPDKVYRYRGVVYAVTEDTPREWLEGWKPKSKRRSELQVADEDAPSLSPANVPPAASKKRMIEDLDQQLDSSNTRHTKMQKQSSQTDDGGNANTLHGLLRASTPPARERKHIRSSLKGPTGDRSLAALVAKALNQNARITKLAHDFSKADAEMRRRKRQDSIFREGDTAGQSDESDLVGESEQETEITTSPESIHPQVLQQPTPDPESISDNAGQEPDPEIVGAHGDAPTETTEDEELPGFTLTYECQPSHDSAPNTATTTTAQTYNTPTPSVNSPPSMQNGAQSTSTFRVPAVPLPGVNRGGQEQRWSIQLDDLNNGKECIHRGRLDGESVSARRRRVKREIAFVKSLENGEARITPSREGSDF